MTQGFIMFDAHERIAVYNERYIEMYGLITRDREAGLLVPRTA